MGLAFNKKRWRRRILVRVLGVLAVLLMVLGGILVWVVKALPGIAAAEISRLTNTRIELGAFDFHRDASVSIDGLVIRPQSEELFYDDTILRAKNVYARFSLGSLLRLSPRVTEIRVEEFMLDVQCNLDTGRWNVADLWPRTVPGGTGRIPTILLRRGKLRYCKVSGTETDVVMSVPVEAHFGLGATLDDGYTFEIRTSKLSGGYGESALRGSWWSGHFELAGGLSSTDIPSLERAWAVDVLAAELNYDSDGKYDLNLRILDLHSKHSPEVDTFRMMAPTALQQSGPLAAFQRFFARFSPSGTVEEIQLEAHGNLDALGRSEITGKVVCKDVSVRDSRFPYTFDHLSGDVDFTQSKVILNQLSGKHGDVDLRIEGWAKGFGNLRQYQYRITSDRMILDEDLYTALSPERKRLWDAFQPSGQIGVDYRLTRSTPFNKRLSLVIDLNDVTATYQKFPYPLKGLTGRLRFDRDSIFATDLRADGNGGQIRLDGKVTGRKTETPVYYISIDANDIPLDATLSRALPEQYRSLYGRFDVNGLADVRARVFTISDANDGEPTSFLADVSLKKTSLRMDELPLPVSDISAEASVTPDSLSIKKLSGRYGPGQVTLTGGVRLARDGKSRQYSLKIATRETPLDEAVLGLLPESIRTPISMFRPEGAVNLLLDLKRTDSNAPIDYEATVECLGDRICHERFAYPLQDVRGTIAMDATGITFKNMRARPALQSESDLAPLIQADGRVSLADDNYGEVALTLRAHDLLFTDALGDALPSDLAGIYRDLSPRGPFDVNLATVRITGGRAAPKVVELEGLVDFKTCSLHVSGTGVELCGALAIEGLYDPNSGFSEGRVHLAADRFTVKGKDVTDLDADIIYDPNNRKWSANNFMGHCYGGRILGDLEVSRAEKGVLRYLMAVVLNRVSLQEFLLAGKLGEAGERSYSSGLLNATLSLGARIGDGSSRLGLCRVDVADMQVGKVSPLASVLAVLSLTEPTDYTFERMLIESYLRRNKLLISRFDLSGKNLAFTGTGTVNLSEGDVDLTLTARGKRVAAAQPSILQSLTEGLGGAVVRVEVTGKADNPKIETKTLPVIEDSLSILGAPR